jgi:hypothetical protein
MATLDLPDDPRTLVWRLIVARLRDDPALSRVIATWLTWDGGRDSNKDLESLRPPALRLYPTLGAMTWHDAQSQTAPLIINIEATISGMDAEDILNLQGAIEDALYPAGADEVAWEAALTAAGAEPPQVEFTQPLTDTTAAAGEGGNFQPLGTFRINVLRTLVRNY